MKPKRRLNSEPSVDIDAFIAQHSADLFKGLTDDQMRIFLGACRIKTCAAPTVLMRQGEPTWTCYLILRGRVEVSFLDIDGNRVLAHVAGPGEVMGEVEIFSGKTCAATCTTLPDTVLAAFSAALAMKHVPFAMLLRNFAGIFHGRLMRDNRQQSVAMFYTAEDRIRIHLLGLTTSEQPEAHISQADLAIFAGCSRQTVNRTLAQLRTEGIVDMARGSIRILDRKRLENTELERVDLAGVP